MENPENRFDKEKNDSDDEEETVFDSKNTRPTKESSFKKAENKGNTEKKESATPAKFFEGKKDEPVKTTESSNESDESSEEIEVDDTEDYLTETEVQEATLAIVDAHTQDVAEELLEVEPDSTEEYEAVALAIFLEELEELAGSNASATEDVIEQAFIEAQNIIEFDDGSEVSSSETDIEYNENTSIDNLETIEPPEVVYEHPEASSQLAIQQTHYSRPQPASSASNTQETIVNSPQRIIQHTRPPQPIYRKQKEQKATINNTNSSQSITKSSNLNSSISGYLVGRRKNIATEQDTSLRINSLEKQIGILNKKITEKEDQIRIVVRQNMELESTAISVLVISERRIKKKQVKELLRRREVLAKDPKVEKIGKFSLPALKVFHEKRLVDESKKPAEKRKPVEAMNRQELLDKVAGLKIHGLDVADMYIKKRLSQKVLRKITKEYLRGGNFRQTFTLELLPDEQEILRKQKKAEQLSKASKADSKAVVGSELTGVVGIKDKQKSASKVNNYQNSTRNNSRINPTVPAVITGLVIGAGIIVLIMLN